MADNKTPEQAGSLESTIEAAPHALIVSQPQKLAGLMETLTLLDKVSESMGEDKSGDMGGGSGGSTQGDDDDQPQSARAQAIANLPTTPLMQKKLQTHIEKEIKQLTKEVKRLAKRSTKPGAAHQLNDVYARIRRLNSLLSEMLQASVDMVKRLYVRIFIDRQTVLDV